MGPGHHNVQNHHVELAVPPLIQLQRLVAGLGLNNLIARPLQIDDHKLPNILFVFRYQHPLHT